MLPAWDALWVIEADNPAFGTPDPFSVRVFSTMASPVPLGVASFVGLILLMRQRGNASILATVAGYTSLALCTVRSAWGLWAIGTVLVLFREKEKLFRFLFVTLAAMFLLFLSTSFQSVRDVLQTRLETFSDLSDDGSFQARTSGYEEMVKYVLANPIGSGLGAMDIVLAGKSELGGRDSGILEIALSLGWVGGATYFFALALIVWNGLTGPVSRTPFEIAAVAISIAVISHMVLSTITGGFSGMALWSFAGISIAARLHPNEP
jgi:O-antigen ligase